MKVPQSAAFRYGVSFMFVVAALLLSLLLERFLPDAFLILFLSAVMLAGWFGRTGPGIFAVVVSTMAVAYFFIAPYRALAVELDEIPYFLAFLLSAVVTSWLGSARRSAEEKQQAHLDELFDQTTEAIMLVDLQDRILKVNREFTHTFGYRIEEIANRKSIELITPESLRAAALLGRKQLVDRNSASIETIRQRRDGSLLNVSEVSFPVIANGEHIASYFIFRDITERALALEKLQKAQADLAHLSRITTMGELAASIAHEINQPIGAIATNSDAATRWLKHTPPNVDEAAGALECIVRDANRAAQVIARIRSLLRKNPTSMAYLDVNEVILEVLTLTSFETNRRGAAVDTELSPRLPPVVGDRVQLQQVLLNLIMNGLEAMSEIADRQRQLSIKCLSNSDCVLVQVLDSGPGLKSGDSTSIFEPFFTTKKNGIGMGLTISRSIIEAHGGRLWAEEGQPYGATINFTLPIARKAE